MQITKLKMLHFEKFFFKLGTKQTFLALFLKKKRLQLFVRIL